MKNIEIKTKGFTLVELMIVLIIIALVVAISSVGAMAMKVYANENLAKSSLKTISTACSNYRVSQGVYPPDLVTLGANYVGGGLEGGEKSGYSFVLKSANDGETFTCVAVPKKKDYTGVKSFCINAMNLIYSYDNAPNLTADGTECTVGGAPLAT